MRFHLASNDRGQWEIHDTLQDGYCVFRTTDAARARTKLAELNQLAESCNRLGIKLETRDDA